MKFSLRSLLCGFVAIVTGGCGSEGDNLSEKEFSQVVDRIPYVLREVDLNLQIEGIVGDQRIGSEEINKSIRYENNSSKDQILRLIEGPAFILTVNGQKAEVKISSAGNIEHVQNIKESAPGCSLTGSSHVTGFARSLNLELEWSLEMALNGPGCDSVMYQKYFNFLEREIEGFHLESVKDITNAADMKRENQKRIRLHVKVKGDTN